MPTCWRGRPSSTVFPSWAVLRCCILHNVDICIRVEHDGSVVGSSGGVTPSRGRVRLPLGCRLLHPAAAAAAAASAAAAKDHAAQEGRRADGSSPGRSAVVLDGGGVCRAVQDKRRAALSITAATARPPPAQDRFFATRSRPPLRSAVEDRRRATPSKT